MSSAPAHESSPATEPQWRRLHPLTPWLRGWAAIVILGGFIINQLQSNLRETIELGREAGVWWIALSILAVLGAVALYNFLWWRMARFHISAESVELTTGILSRRHRSLRLDQLEAVDIVHPLVARLFGLAELRLESAGGQDSHLSLAYLTSAQAEAVRAVILSRRSVPPDAPSVDPAQQTHLFRVPPQWTIRAYFRTWEPWIMVVIAAGSVTVSVMTQTWGGLAAILPVFFGFAQTFWKHIVTEMGFTGYVHPEGIHLTHGLLTQVNQSIPAARIQAIRLRQRWLWRNPGWWRIDLNVAGYGLASGQNRNVLVPVADPGMAIVAVQAVMPRATVPDIWAVIDQAMHATGATPGFVGSPDRARIFDPLAWRRQGYARTPYAIVIRTGWFTRTITIIPHDRIQGFSVSSGPWERRRGLASASLHSTMGPIFAKIPHLDPSHAASLLREEVPLVTGPTLCTPQ